MLVDECCVAVEVARRESSAAGALGVGRTFADLGPALLLQGFAPAHDGSEVLGGLSGALDLGDERDHRLNDAVRAGELTERSELFGLGESREKPAEQRTLNRSNVRVGRGEVRKHLARVGVPRTSEDASRKAAEQEHIRLVEGSRHVALEQLRCYMLHQGPRRGEVDEVASVPTA